MSFEKEMVLYHSTDGKSLDQICAARRLFGHELLTPSDGYSGGSNLTTDKHASQQFIIDYRGKGQWRLVDGLPRLVTVAFGMPQKLVKHVGKTRFYGCDEYATHLTVDAGDLPWEYLDGIHAGMQPTTKKRAIELQQAGIVRYYEVPLGYLTSVETVVFTYQGIAYPSGT